MDLHALLFKLSSSRFFRARILAATALLSFLAPGRAAAQGNLLVTPRRVVFEGSSRIKELNLANIGNDTAKYLISVMEIRMTENGTFEQITAPDPGQLFASENLRIYPRTVNIPPGGAQMVKVQLTKTAEMAPGEYRSHIYIRAVPMEPPLGDSATAAKKTEISVKLVAVFGISIPAIIRIGENDTKVSLTDAAFIINEEKKPQLSITLNRSGLMSSYGDMTVECISPNGKVRQVGLVKGIAVYTPNQKRRFNMELERKDDIDYRKCQLHIVYKSQKDAKTQDFSEAVLALQ